jgi:integrase
VKGSTYKRCGCRGADGKQLGARCPKLRRKDGTWNPRHGAWTFTVSYAGRNGKRTQVVRGGFASEAEAQAGLDKAKSKLSRGVSVTGVMAGLYFPEWLDAKGDIRPATRRSYAGHIKNHLIPHLGHHRLDELRVEHVADMLAEVQGGDATRQRVRATLRSVLSDAMRQGLVTVNVASLVKLPAGKRPKALVWTTEREARWREAVAAHVAVGTTRTQARDLVARPSPVMVWRPDQLGVFLDTATGDRLYALYHLIAYRGLRRGEAAGLEWEDVDLDSAALAVRRQRVQLGWEVIEEDPKSDAGERTIALDTGTVTALRAHRRAQLTERLACPAWEDSGKVFTRENGEPLHPATITDRFHELVAAADLPPVRLHDLRHGAASLMLAAGVDLKVVQETLGHSSITLTSDTYTSVYPAVAAAAADAAAALVPRAAGTDVVTSLSRQGADARSKTENRWSDSAPPGTRTPNPLIKSRKFTHSGERYLGLCLHWFCRRVAKGTQRTRVNGQFDGQGPASSAVPTEASAG